MCSRDLSFVCCPLHKILVCVFGVSGSGKTTIASKLCSKYPSSIYVEADEFHSASSVAKMQAGIGLTDEDRRPWLESIIYHVKQQKSNLIFLACSFIKARYRDLFRQEFPDILFIWLRVPPDQLLERLIERKGHFANSSLLKSQLEDFEPPSNEPKCLIHEFGNPESKIFDAIALALDRSRIDRAPMI